MCELSPEQNEERVLAQRYGFQCTPDPARGAGWYFFTRGDYCVWYAGQWLAACRHRNRSAYPTLELALAAYRQDQ